jgi:large conductance mechanosensitive channel
MAPMRKLWSEFRAIAIGGTVLDLALGFIIGTAFATLIQSFVTNIFLQFVAVFIGKRDFEELVVHISGTPINIGQFLDDILQFLLLAVALFFIVKLMTLIGVERGRSFAYRQCPFCLDRIPRGAFTCRSCGQQLVQELPALAEAERQLAEREAWRWPTLPPLRRRSRSSDDEEVSGTDEPASKSSRA